MRYHTPPNIAAMAVMRSAGMTPSSAASRLWMQRFRFGGPRVFRNQGGEIEPRLGQDFENVVSRDMEVPPPRGVKVDFETSIGQNKEGSEDGETENQ